ncbi:MAG: DL-methionine transporter ATP-binding subunit [Coxiellaceae bacterium]|nr:DL-methionine transporter ATP-binding subunit [Coxiellaceae bacterium]
MIQLNNIQKSYYQQGKRVPIIRSVSLNVDRGEIYCVIGKSGAGKSTLLRCVNQLVSIDKGNVEVDGTRIDDLSKSELRDFRKRIGVIFQHFNLLESKTVWGNVALPLQLLGYSTQAIEERVAPLLDLVDLTAHKDQTPSQLSGGQKQRVAIARALATNPDVLLCDEPTSALDPESTQSIIQLLKKINREMQLTLLWITHEMDVVKAVADRVGVMHAGELVEEGSVEALFVKPKEAITRRLTLSSLHADLPEIVQETLQDQPGPDLSLVARLLFTGEATHKPILTELYDELHVTVNILQANLDHVGHAVMGFVLCQFIGEPELVKQALVYLRERNVMIEEIGYA